MRPLPDGKRALSVDNGAAAGPTGTPHGDRGRSGGDPPRVIDKVVVGDAPEGFAISPTGKLAVALLLNGNDAAKNGWFYNRNGKVVALRLSR